MFVYLLQCADETLYTGIAVDLTKRLEEHNHSKRGARYTKSRRPVVLVYSELQPTRSEALRRECELKRLSRAEKLALIERFSSTQSPA